VTRRALLGLAAALVLTRWAGPARAQSVTAETAPRYFRVEYQTGTDQEGRPLVWGYVYNDRGLGHARVRILVETLDASGKPIAQEIDYVDGEVLLYNRSYYEVRPRTTGPKYRVNVYSADWTRSA
jgi:hypothetical protein